MTHLGKSVNNELDIMRNNHNIITKSKSCIKITDIKIKLISRRLKKIVNRHI